ncbi:MAG: hypothetical protein ABEH35_00560 [Haloarculaceae archaeon]
MQRRAAAIYFVFFVVIGAAAYAYIGVAQDTQQPHVDLDAEATLAEGDSATLAGQQYTVSSLGHESGGGGGGMTATLAWTNSSFQYTATLENNSTVRNDTYRVIVANESDVDSFTLREEQNVSAILAADPAVEDQIATQNGTKYVVFRENDTLRPLSAYLPEPDTERYATGDTYEYQGNETTVASVTTEGVTLEWTGEKGQSVELTEGSNVTLNGQTYFAHFPDSSSVQLVPTSEYDTYSTQRARIDYFHERMSGLWGITILSGIVAVLLLSTAYLPVRG